MDGSEASPRHQCLIYQGTPASHLDDIAGHIIQKLQDGYRCLYLHSPAMVAGMRFCLERAGLSVAKETEKGALILSSDQSHLENGKFDPERMIVMLDQMLQKALADGYKGLWASGDMSWEFGAEENLSKLFEYEYMLDEYMQKHPELAGICQYHRDSLPLHAIQTALHTHKAVKVNSTILSFNPYYKNPRGNTPLNANEPGLHEIQGLLKGLSWIG